MSRYSMEAVNAMARGAFVDAFGGIFEHSPWVAERAWERRPFESAEALLEAMRAVVAEASDGERLTLLRAHPDLAGRLAIGELTALSAAEQQGAGLDRLTPAEYETFGRLNRDYVARFGFPFIVAVRGMTKDDILAAMQARAACGAETERAEALRQVCRIAGFRLQDLIDS